MTEISAERTDEAGRPILEMVLRPHRSLSKRGFAVVMAVMGGMMATIGVGFFAIGAWPIMGFMGFMGLDIALVLLAFLFSFRSARAAQEIRVTRDRLTVLNLTSPGGRTQTTFNPYWARLEIARGPDEGIVAMQFASGAVRQEIGRFLALPEREPVASALRSALVVVRGGAR
jgi:uncharacterized membrane protein